MSKKKGKNDEFKSDDILQAIVIADSFNVRFAPLSKAKPKALFPLVNVPLLDYTLEFLDAAGIEQVILFCSNHATLIKDHITNSKWNSQSQMEVITIVSESAGSMGDALRDIFAKSLINGDFILVNGDVVSNVQLKPLIDAHKQRKLIDKGAVMTLVMSEAEPGHSARCREDECVLTVAKANNRILTFHRLSNIKRQTIDLELFKDLKEIKICHDLLDSQIAICSPTVLSIFDDNFDYLTREDFIKGILENEEIMGNTIHLHTLKGQYAVRVTNLPMYEAVSQHVMSRWSYPLVPDAKITEHPDDEYSYNNHSIYRHKDITLAKGCKLVDSVVIGKGSSIGCNSVITRSVIGKNCTIGKDVRLDGAYLWDNVTVGDGCTILSTICDNHVCIKSGVTLQKGSVLGEKVVVGPDVVIPQGTFLSAEIYDSGFGDEDQSTENQESELRQLLGKEGLGYIYSYDDDSDTDEPLVVDIMGLSLTDSEDDDEEEEVSSEEESEEEMLEDSGSPPPDEFKLFYDEVTGTLERAMTENIGIDNIVLEINSLKHAYGIQIKEVNHLVTKAIFELPVKLSSNLDAAQYLTQLVSNLKNLKNVLRNYIKSEDSQQDCLESFEELCLANSTISLAAIKVLHYLYNADILSEEVIIEWYNNPDEDKDDLSARKTLRKQVETFVQWLEEAEEESEDESD